MNIIASIAYIDSVYDFLLSGRNLNVEQLLVASLSCGLCSAISLFLRV